MAKRFGMNIAGPGENFELTYANALRQHRGWTKATLSWDKDPNLPVDAIGEPLADFSFIAPVQIGEQKPYLAGTYELSFVGTAKVNVDMGTGTIAGKSYHKASNTTTVIIVVPPSNTNTLAVQLTETRRRPADRAGTGLSRLKLMRPVTVGATTFHHRDELFSRDWLAALRDFELIRGMDWLFTNGYGMPGYGDATWAKRTLPKLANQYFVLPGRVGACLEDLVEAANLANVDLYVNIPDTADLDYITRLMQLVAFGSDGVEPYAGPQPLPAYRGLKPGLKFYFAWSNEVWNAMFTQCPRNDAAGRAEVAAGKSPLNYDGTTDAGIWFRRRVVERLRICSDAARRVFGDAAMMTRVRPVLESFIADPTTLSIPLDFLNNYYNNGDGKPHVATPRPPSYYVWGGGGGGYRQPADKATAGDARTADAVFASGLEPASHANEVKILAGYGLEHASYEMGFDISDAVFNEFTSKLTSDPRCRPLARQTLADYYADGGSLGIQYCISTGNWRVLDAIGRLDHPKYLGLKEARDHADPESPHLPAVPAAAPVPATHGTYGAGGTLHAQTYRFPTGGYLTYTLYGSQAVPPGTPALAATLDGHPAATAELPPERLGGGRGWSRPLVVPVGPGLHTVRLAATGPMTIPFGRAGAMTFAPSPPAPESRRVFGAARFPGKAGTPLPKTPEGPRWSKQFGLNDFVATGDGGMRIAGSGFGNEIAYLLDARPPSPDYEVAATLDLAQLPGNRCFLTIRAGTTAGDNGYCGGVMDSKFALYNHTTNANLGDNDAHLQDFAGTVRLRLRATGPLIQLFVDDFEVCRATDTKYTQAGFGGFYFAANAPTSATIRAFELATIAAAPPRAADLLVRLEAGATDLTLVAGRPQTVAVRVTPPPGYQGPITLRLDDLPGVVATFDPPLLNGAGTSTLALVPADATRFAERPWLLSALAGPASVTVKGTVRATRERAATPAKVGLSLPAGTIGVPDQGEICLLGETAGVDLAVSLHGTGVLVPPTVTIPADATAAAFPCTPTASTGTAAAALPDLAGWATAHQVAFEPPAPEQNHDDVFIASHLRCTPLGSAARDLGSEAVAIDRVRPGRIS